MGLLFCAPISPVSAQTPTLAPSPLVTNREAVVTALRVGEMELNAGVDEGLKVGEVYSVERGAQVLGRIRLTSVSADGSRAQILSATPEGATLNLGERVVLRLVPGEFTPVAPLTPLPPTGAVAVPDASSTNTESASSTNASPANPPRINRGGDYLAALAGLALVLSADASPSTDAEKAFVGDQQYSAISPFAGGGYSVRPDGDLRPGGAMHVNIPLAYTPRRVSVNVGVFAAQTREGDSLGSDDGRNGTFNVGVGFPVRGRGVWLSRMGLSKVSVGGGDRAYNALVQVVSETGSVPAIALGIQDATNSRERSPFIVATKQLGTRPLFGTIGVGRGRFSGDTIFGGVSFAPFERLSLAAEYDGLQFNIGASVAVTQRFSVLASLNDLNEQEDRPAGNLGRRYQVGASYNF